MRVIKTTLRNGRHGPITSYYFRNGEREYLVEDTKLRNGKHSVTAYVYFYRETSNVFGNGSTSVWQSGWRKLPNGPKRCELEKQAELISLRSQLSLA
jgi:hypothetical protein